MGFEPYEVPAESALLVKALKIWRLAMCANLKTVYRRLLSQQSVWEDLLKEVTLCDIQFSLKTGIRTELEALAHIGCGEKTL